MIGSDELRFFDAIASARSLASAARRLNVSPPAVTQRLRGLEDRLGVQLVDRSTRHLTLTGEGELLAERGQAVLEALCDLDDAIANRRGEVTGHLRVIASLGFGRRYVAPVIARFQADHPKVAVDLLLSDRLDRLPDDAWDVAVHVGGMKDAQPSLNIRHLAANERLVCAAPSYIARRGGPVRPADLRGHACIALRENDGDVTLWRFSQPDGKEERVRIEPNLASNDGEVVKNWALDGRGIIVRSEWDVSADIRAGRLVHLLTEYRLPTAPILALLGSRQQSRAARTRHFLQALQAAFHPIPWRR